MQRSNLASRPAFTLIAALTALGLAGCPASDPGKPSLGITVSPTSVVADGTQSVMVAVTGVDAEKNPLVGNVLVTTTAGTFDNGQKSLTSDLSNGSLQLTLTTCDSSAEDGCAGTARITAILGATQATATVTFEAYCPGGPGPETDCADGVDNDCNGQTDCADAACASQACNAFGSTCDDTGTCACPHADPEGTAAAECYDGLDNDCDGLTDGEDADCKDQACDSQGNVWSENPDGSLLCTCVPAQTTESTCNDDLDNDCDGVKDCADPDCASTSCEDASLAPNDVGLTCVSNGDGTGACVCAADTLGNGQEATCDDGIDDDCDGLVDCADTQNCNNKPCGPNGEVCNASGACACTKTVETCVPDAAGQWPDDDCDGFRGCDDSDCNGQICGADGLTCVQSTCTCPGGDHEASCGDSRDNDCDTLTDCADPDCNLVSCGNGKICDLSTSSCITDPGINRVDIVVDDGHYTVPADPATEVVLTATVQNNSGVIASYDVDFSVDAGGLTEASGGRTFTATTDAQGQAKVHWRTGTTPSPGLTATATVVSNPMTGATVSKDISVQVVGLDSIEVQSIENSTMGLKDSGWKETSLVTFVLKGTDGQSFGLAMPDGASVEFALDTTAGGLTLSRFSDTSVGSRVSTTAVAGTQVVSFTVTGTATVGVGSDSVVAGPINIVGAKPSHQGFTVACEQKNINGLGTFLQDSDLTSTNLATNVDCSATLQDRFGNPVQRPDIRVKFFAEGGTIQSDKAIAMGVSTTTYTAYGDLPADVTPMGSEPSWTQTVTLQDGSTVSRTRNPRDGLVTIIAFISGEEAFTDLNGNGAYDAGEPFVDLAEPYIDENDNSIHDPNERFWDVNNDNVFNGPNGTWDGNTLIWTETRLLLSGCQFVLPGNQTGFIDAPMNPYIDNGGTLNLTYRMTDINMNLLAPGTRLSASKVAGVDNKVNIEIEASGTNFTVPDGWGMSWGLSTDKSATPWTVRSIIVPPTPSFFGAQVGFRISDSQTSETDPPTAFSVRLSSGPCNPNLAYGLSGTND